MPFAVSGTRGCEGGDARRTSRSSEWATKPRTVSEAYSHLFEEVEPRLAEGAQVGVGFDIPAYIAPNCYKGSVRSDVQVNM
jgi:hypothetical protein